MDFNERLSKLIKEKGLTKKQFLEDMKLGKNQISYWNNNKTIPNQSTLIAIANYFDVSVEYLKCETEQKDINLSSAIENITFFKRYEQLCIEHGMKPQNPEMFKITGVSSGAISGWKKGSLPKGDVLCRLSKYFNVTTDYLLGLTELRNSSVVLTEEETILVEAYRSANAQGRFNIINVCMNEKIIEKENIIAG